MAEPSNTLSSRLPETRDVQIIKVQLPDGRIIVRTPDELAALPPEERAALVILNPPGKVK